MPSCFFVLCFKSGGEFLKNFSYFTPICHLGLYLKAVDFGEAVGELDAGGAFGLVFFYAVLEGEKITNGFFLFLESSFPFYFAPFHTTTDIVTECASE